MKTYLSELEYVQQYYRVPEQPAPKSRFKLLKRFVTRCLLHFIRGQNEFNLHMARVVHALHDQLEEYHEETLRRMGEIETVIQSTAAALQRQSQQHSAVQAVLSKRVHESDQRQDAIVASLHSTDIRIDELISRVDKVVESLSSTDRSLVAVIHTVAQHSTALEALEANVRQIDKGQNEIFCALHESDKRIDEVVGRQDTIVESLARTDREVSKVIERQDQIVGAVHATDKRVDEVVKRQDAIVESLAHTDQEVSKLIRRQDEIVAAVHATDKRIDEVLHRQDAVIQSLHAVEQRCDGVTARHDAIVEALHRTDVHLQQLARHYDALVAFIPQAEQLRIFKEDLALLQERLRDLAQRQDELVSEFARLHEVTERCTCVLNELEQIGAKCDTLANALATANATVKECEKQVMAVKTSCDEKLEQVFAGMGSVQALVTELRVTVEEQLSRAASILAQVEKARRSSQELAKAAEVVEVLRPVSSHSVLPSSSAYHAYEELQRGPEELIHARLREYVPWLRRAPASRKAPILDLGTGRGEFLELLREIGLRGYGVDINPCAVQHARSKGLDVREQDLFNALREVKPHSLAAITAFHVIEHLPFHAICELIALARRALRPEGLLIVETPNVFNLQVAAIDFYKDPTHVRPVHPTTLDMWLRCHGFSRVHVEFLHPFPAGDQLCVSRSIKPQALRRDLERLNQLLYGYRDCAVIAFADRLALSVELKQRGGETCG